MSYFQALVNLQLKRFLRQKAFDLPFNASVRHLMGILLPLLISEHA